MSDYFTNNTLKITFSDIIAPDDMVGETASGILWAGLLVPGNPDSVTQKSSATGNGLQKKYIGAVNGRTYAGPILVTASSLTNTIAAIEAWEDLVGATGSVTQVVGAHTPDAIANMTLDSVVREVVTKTWARLQIQFTR